MRDFSKERLSIEPGRDFMGADPERPYPVLLGQMRGSPRDYGSVLSPAELDTFTAQLAARWNACADALERAEPALYQLVDDPAFAPILNALELLSRAVNGEG